MWLVDRICPQNGLTSNFLWAVFSDWLNRRRVKEARRRPLNWEIQALSGLNEFVQQIGLICNWI